MFRNIQDSRLTARGALRFAVCGALATALVGCAGSSHLAKAGNHAKQAAAKTDKQGDRAVALAEKQVQAAPLDAARRAALGNAYLSVGRFESATATFQDAVALGDDSGSTALRLALAQAATGRNAEAIMLLDAHRDDIPASDLGLALALAGETSRGVDVLVDALRGGENTAKLRQNLAYAYALDGRWNEAKMMASQDVAPDKLDKRITDWAMQGKPEDQPKRVAGLLGTPLLVSDPGQPAALALADRPATAPAKPQFAAVEASGELPASDPSREFVLPEPEQAAPVPASAPAPARFAAAFPEAPRAAPQPRIAHAVKAKAPAPVAAKPLKNGSHALQLGAFASPDGARRAIAVLRSRNPELKGYDLTVTPAVVRGKNYWRVAASGFSQGTATGTCSKIRVRGGGCIAYATGRPLPGAVPAGRSGPALARR